MDTEKYLNRTEAGKLLSQQLLEYAHRSDVLVLALPRGGVPVAFEVANALKAPLDVFIVRKLGVPGHEELALGALAMGGETVFNDEVIQSLHISKQAIQQVIEAETTELNRRERKYRGSCPFPVLTNKTIILVDDGIATGATIHAAIQALRKHKPLSIVVAVPVAEYDTCQKIAQWVDKMVCPNPTRHFYAVGQWYDDFSQTTDEEVYHLLNQARK